MTITRSAAEPADLPEIVLDLSRLLSRFRHNAPTGVDRVEMAYAREMLVQAPERLFFAAVHPAGHFYGRLSTRAAVHFLEQTAAEWAQGRGSGTLRLLRWWRHTRLLWALRPRRIPRRAQRRRVLVQSSPHHLHDQAQMQRILRREGADLICLLHDLIPIEFPEYARPGGEQQHRRRIATVAALASAVVANSKSTLDSFVPRLRAASRQVPVIVAHLGLDADPSPPRVLATTAGRGHFIFVGTIEPRKNHLLILQVWRRLAETHGAHTIPKLVIVGRRGWENEQVVDLLERCSILKQCVVEHGRVSDHRMHGLLASALGLLLPSFAEGYGMPVVEALSTGVPVLCSDIPALREAGRGVPEYLDPLDGPAWIEAVLSYADPSSPRRLAQLARMRHWTPPTWHAHVATVLRLAKEISR